MPNRLKILYYGRELVPGSYPLHSSFRRYRNYLQRGYATPDDPVQQRVLGVTAAQHEASPLNLVVNRLELLPEGPLLVTEQGVVGRQGEASFAEGVCYDPALPEGRCSRKKFGEWYNRVRCTAAAAAEPGGTSFVLVPEHRAQFRGGFARALLERLETGVAALQRGEWFSCAELLRGTGSGLTPSGDDFCAGLLYALWLDQELTGRNRQKERRQLYEKCVGSSIFSNTFLQSAYLGTPYAALRELLAVLFVNGQAEVAGLTRGVLEMGHSSGTDLLSGLLTGLEQLQTGYNL